MKHTMILTALIGGMAASTGTAAWAADEGPWLIRARAVYLDPDNKSDAIPALAVPSDAIHVSTKTIPEVDITYFITKNIAAELILTYPQKHDVTIEQSALGNIGKIGTFKHLPPTLTVQYHFLPDGNFRPYVGAGINYTRISSVNLNIAGVGKLDLENSSFGYALQAGFDYKVGANTFINFDVKKIQIESDLSLGGTKVSHLKVDPLAVGVGFGWRF